MEQNKKYFWLKLKNNFFTQPHVKRLAKTAKGKQLVLIYLKLLLLSVCDDGMLYFDHLEDDFTQELSLILDEKAKDVAQLLAFMQKHGLIEQLEEDVYRLPEATENLGAETASTVRSRKCRANKALQCNIDATDAQQLATQSKSREEKELKQELKLEREPKSAPAGQLAGRQAVYPPTLTEIQEFCKGKAVDSERFFNYYQANGWQTGTGRPIVNWQALVQNWEKTEQAKPAHKRVSTSTTLDLEALDRMMNIVPSLHD